MSPVDFLTGGGLCRGGFREDMLRALGSTGIEVFIAMVA